MTSTAKPLTSEDDDASLIEIDDAEARVQQVDVFAGGVYPVTVRGMVRPALPHARQACGNLCVSNRTRTYISSNSTHHINPPLPIRSPGYV